MDVLSLVFFVSTLVLRSMSCVLCWSWGLDGLLVAGMASGPQGVSFKAGSWWLGQGTKEEGELWIVSESTERVGEVCRWVDCLGFWWLS